MGEGRCFLIALCLFLAASSQGCFTERSTFDGGPGIGPGGISVTVNVDDVDRGVGTDVLNGFNTEPETIPDLVEAATREEQTSTLTGATTQASSRGLTSVGDWLYILQGNDPDLIAAAGKFLVVTDFGRNGSSAFAPSEVQRMQRGGKTIVLSYISIGEAEDWRFYPMPSCAGPENPDWPGCRWVRYWDPEWENILMGQGGYLDKILGAGFDGIYLDKVDAYEEVPDGVGVSRGDARARMIALVRKIASYCRQRKPLFLVFPQNAAELFDDASYASVCDGIGQEETWFAATDLPRSDSAQTERRLTRIRLLGKTVLTVDYCRGDNARRAEERSRGLGFVPFTTGDVRLAGLP